MPVHSARLFGPTPLSNAAWTQLYVVPADRTAVFRALIVSHAGGQYAAQPGVLGVGAAGAQRAVAMFTVQKNGAPYVLQDLVLNPGDVLWGSIDSTGANNGVMVTGAGSRLSGVAPA